MNDFMEYDFNISKISLAIFLQHNTTRVHKNRPNHGLAMFISDGVAEYIFDNGQTVKVRKNEIVYLPKNSSYVVSGTDHALCYAINFDIDQSTSFKSFAFKAKDAGQFVIKFKKAEQVWKTKKHGLQMKVKAYLYDILYTMQQEYFLGYIPQRKRELIQPALDYIHKNYTEEPLSIAFLSDMCRITPEYFRKVFKNMYGVSPLLYINNLKIAHAKELLESEMYSVTEAAFLSGFTDASHFSREFKKATGVPPSLYKG